MGWSTRRTPPWARLRSSTLRSRFSTSQTRSRRATLQSASCAAAALPAASPTSSGRWAKRREARRWRTLTPSSPTRWLSAASSLSSAAARVRQLQELRGSFSRGVHGRQRCRHAGQGYHCRAEGRCWCGWQEEVRCKAEFQSLQKAQAWKCDAHFVGLYSLYRTGRKAMLAQHVLTCQRYSVRLCIHQTTRLQKAQDL